MESKGVSRRVLASVVLLALGATGALFGAAAASSAPTTTTTVRSVADGDTLTLTDGRRIRLVQVDTPELGSGECYSRAAYKVLLALVHPGTRVTLESDPLLDRVDRYGRLLRYVRLGNLNVNLELVHRGAATPYFYGGERGRYASLLMRAAESARSARRGLWGACPDTVLDPLHAASTGVAGPPVSPPTTSTPPGVADGNCAASYPGVCIAPPPPDLDCKDVPDRRFAVRWDVPDPDPHRFDGDHDGIGCES